MSNDHKCTGRFHQGAILGNSVDIRLKECEASEVRADVLVESATKERECHVVRLWGQVKDCNGVPVSNALIKLIKVTNSCCGVTYQGVAHTISDCEGFYQFDLCYCSGNETYKVLVGKTYTGPEEVICTGKGNCDVCQCEKPCQQACQQTCQQTYQQSCQPSCPPPCTTSCQPTYSKSYEQLKSQYNGSVKQGLNMNIPISYED